MGTTKYGRKSVDVGMWVVAGRGEDRDYGKVLFVDSASITIGWDSGTCTTIDLVSNFVDDDTIEVYETRELARRAVVEVRS